MKGVILSEKPFEETVKLRCYFFLEISSFYVQHFIYSLFILRRQNKTKCDGS